MRRRLGAFRHCYERALRRDPDLAGDVILRWRIHPDGSVDDASAVSADIADVAMIECLSTVASAIRYPVQEDGAAAILVSYPLRFRREIRREIVFRFSEWDAGP